MTTPRLALAAALAFIAFQDIAIGENLTSIGAFMDGNALLDACNDPADAARCKGYMMGVADTGSIAQSLGGAINGWRVCVPRRVSSSQVTEIVVTYLRAHPELRHRAAASLVMLCLSKAFRCR